MFTIVNDILEEYPEQSLDQKIMNYWEDMINSGLLTDENINYVEVDLSVLNQWVLNFTGLLKAVTDIPDKYIYPNMRINGITDYEFTSDRITEFTKIKVIDPTTLEYYYREYIQKYENDTEE